jgi:hypothetical protein
MENVPGILSSKVNGLNTFDMILRDLRNPHQAIAELNGDLNGDDEALGYEIYSLVKSAEKGTELKPSDYIIKSETSVFHRPDTGSYFWAFGPILVQNHSTHKSRKTGSMWDANFRPSKDTKQVIKRRRFL